MLPLSESSTYLHYGEQNVLKFQSKSDVEKYSAATNSGAEFVTICNIKNSNRKSYFMSLVTLSVSTRKIKISGKC